MAVDAMSSDDDDEDDDDGGDIDDVTLASAAAAAAATMSAQPRISSSLMEVASASRDGSLVFETQFPNPGSQGKRLGSSGRIFASVERLISPGGNGDESSR